MVRELLIVATKKFVSALDPIDGREVWRTKLPGVDSGVISIILRENDVFAGIFGHVFCLNRTTGAIVWQNDLPGMGYQHVILAMDGIETPNSSIAAYDEIQRQAAASAGAAAATTG